MTEQHTRARVLHTERDVVPCVLCCNLQEYAAVNSSDNGIRIVACVDVVDDAAAAAAAAAVLLPVVLEACPDFVNRPQNRNPQPSSRPQLSLNGNAPNTSSSGALPLLSKQK